MDNITIEKYLIMNSEKEVLIFLREGEEITDIFLPRRTKFKKEPITFQKRIYSLLKTHISLVENRVLLYEQPLYDYPDNEGDLDTHDVINKEYYMCLCDFDDELVTKINMICNEYNVLPFMVSLNALKNRAWRNIKVEREKRKYAIDIDLPKPIRILQYKLDYVEY